MLILIYGCDVESLVSCKNVVRGQLTDISVTVCLNNQLVENAPFYKTQANQPSRSDVKCDFSWPEYKTKLAPPDVKCDLSWPNYKTKLTSGDVKCDFSWPKYETKLTSCDVKRNFRDLNTKQIWPLVM